MADNDESSLSSLPTNSDASLIVEASSSNKHEDKNKNVVVGSPDTWYMATCESENEMALTR